MMSRNLICVVLASVGLAAGLAACAMPTPYQPAKASDREAAGYSEIQLEADRWRVTFLGNTLTSRQTVETYLLYRSAELTRDQGYDWFIAVTRGTEAHETLRLRPAPEWGYGWYPRWRLADHTGWRTWETPLDPPPLDLSSVTAYEAVAEIRLGRGRRPDDPRAFDARSVLTTLQSRIVRPE